MPRVARATTCEQRICVCLEDEHPEIAKAIRALIRRVYDLEQELKAARAVPPQEQAV